MPRLAANLSMMFNEVPFLERFTAARKAGFEGVEFLFPYDHDLLTAPVHQVAQHANPVGLRQFDDDRGIRDARFEGRMRCAVRQPSRTH